MKYEINNIGKICAVVITFNIGEGYRKNFETLHRQVDKVIIVDNGSDFATINVLRAIQTDYKDKVEVIFKVENVGLGKAQNIGINKAIEENYDWILLLDHDSYLEEDMIFQIKKYYSSLNHEDREKIAILAPNVTDTNINTSSRYIQSYMKIFFGRKGCFKGKYVDTLAVIASGSLINSTVIKKIGLMKEEFFIDYIDTEFSLRAITNGFKIIVVCDAVLYHTLGERKLYRVFNINIKPTFHSAERRFYIYRNRIKVWKTFIFKVPSYILFDVIAAVYDISRILFFEPDKKNKLRMILKGITSGIKE